MLQELFQRMNLPLPGYEIEDPDNGLYNCTISCQGTSWKFFGFRDRKLAKRASADIMLGKYFQEHKVDEISKEFLINKSEHRIDTKWKEQLKNHLQTLEAKLIEKKKAIME